MSFLFRAIADVGSAVVQSAAHAVTAVGDGVRSVIDAINRPIDQRLQFAGQIHSSDQSHNYGSGNQKQTNNQSHNYGSGNQKQTNTVTLNPSTYRLANEPTFSVNPKMLTKVDTQLIVQSPSTDSAFKAQMEFIAKNTREYDRNDVIVVVIVVGLSKHTCLHSSSFQSQASFEEALRSTSYLGHCADVSRCLKVARENCISTYGGRSNVKKMALLLNNEDDTPSGDENAAINEANKIKTIVSEMVVVSVGKQNRTFLNQLASKKENVLSYANVRELNEKGIGQLKVITCTIAPKYDPPADILFIIDSSGSIGQDNYKKELEFVVGLTEYFNIGPRNTDFGAMLFSDSPQMLFYLTTKAHESIKRTVLEAPYFAKGTNTAAALREARLNGLRINARPKHQKIAIVITDGCSDDKSNTESEANMLKDSGVRVIAIGVGSANQEELKAIASSQMYIYYVESYGVLGTIYKRIVELASESF